MTFEKERIKLVFVGRVIFESGLTDTHGGNISMKVDDYILIKKSGKMLGYLEPNDIVVTTLENNPELDKEASIELKVHRAIYKKLPWVNGIVHAHSPYTVACSLLYDEVKPLDSEGKLILGTVPVLSAKEVVSSDEVAEKLPELLTKSPVAIVKSHGPFAVGKSIEEALRNLSALENSCKIISIIKSMER